MKRLDDTVDAMFNRMYEFYTDEDLVLFDDFIKSRHYSDEMSYTFLDMQTRVDYFACNGNVEPKISTYIHRLSDYMRKMYPEEN